MAQKKRVSCFIDGFNLYHAIDDLGDGQGNKLHYLKWINLWGLSEAFVKTSQEKLDRVLYFSAMATWKPDAMIRHREFLKANTNKGVRPILGNFKEKDRKCNNCNSTWIAHEEKQSDVNIAIYLLHFAHKNIFDKALIISADSDLCPAINLVLDSFPDKEINILVPPNRYQITNELRHIIPSYKIKQKHLKNNLLPENILADNEKVLATRPVKYTPVP